MVEVLIADGPPAAVWDDRQLVEWENGRISVVSQAGLITLKLAAARPQDLADVQRLEELGRG